jgi:hypothetical protein
MSVNFDEILVQVLNAVRVFSSIRLEIACAVDSSMVADRARRSTYAETGGPKS